MRIALINGSPKVKGSASARLLEVVKEFVNDNCEIAEIHIRTATLTKEDLDKINLADALIFAFPLYVDGIPGHLLSCLTQIEKAGEQNKEAYVYGISNCGFYEGIQNDVALNILRNFSHKTGLTWGGGIGVGGGGCISMLPNIPTGKGPMALVDKAIKSMVDCVLNKTIQEDKYVSIAMPRIAYKLAAQAGWRHMIKANGLKVKDLDTRLD